MTWITENDYFGPWWGHDDITEDVRKNSDALLSAVNVLMYLAFEDGIDFDLNPATQSYISGKTLGGFRPQDATQGAPNSSHKTGAGVDIYDKGCAFAQWCYKHQDKLRQCGLYMEHPDATKGWCHLTTRAPKSGKICFMP